MVGIKLDIHPAFSVVCGLIVNSLASADKTVVRFAGQYDGRASALADNSHEPLRDRLKSLPDEGFEVIRSRHDIGDTMTAQTERRHSRSYLRRFDWRVIPQQRRE